MRLARIFLALIVLVAGPGYANWCATPGRDGTAATLSGVVNTYYTPAASVAAGATSVVLTGSSGAGQAIASGDLLLFIQMQDASIDERNSARYGSGVNGVGGGYLAAGQTGRYEFVRATGSVPALGGTLTFVGGTGGGLTYAYNHSAPSATAARKTFQVVKVPQYDQATVTGTVSALPWNGSVGGVVAIDVARRLTFAGGTISASGLGFRGGGGRDLDGGSGLNTDYMTSSSNTAHASKGEGIAGTPRYLNNQGVLLDALFEGLVGGSYGRGAPANAGGGGTDGNPIANDQNTGGGGGGHGGAGGRGGHAWCSTAPTGCSQSGGIGGSAIKAADLGVTRAYMGGGGGAGTNNNGTGTGTAGFASSGAAGGGIVFVRAGEIAGTGSFVADGAGANSTVLNDSNGGGGAGGAIFLAALRIVSGSALTASAKGGNGGSNTGGGSAHGPGGGGGGGYVAATFTLSTNVTGGLPGSTVNGGSFGSAYGAVPGTGGAGISITGASIPGLSSGGECTPTVTKSFATSPVAIGAASRMSIVVTNNNPTTSLTNLAFTDTYPSGLRNTASPSAAASCGSGTLTAAASGTSFGVAAATISAAASCTFSVNTTVTSTGDKTNVIAVGGLTGRYGSHSVGNLEAASAIIQVSAPLTIVKASQSYSDPLNGTTNSKAIPGGFVTYTVTVANPGSGTVDSNTIIVVDATPANLEMFVGDLTSGSGPLAFQQGSSASALTYSFASLSSTSDDIEFSNNNGSTWAYTPTPNASGVDPAITHFRVRPKGAMAANSSFSLQFRYRIK